MRAGPIDLDLGGDPVVGPPDLGRAVHPAPPYAGAMPLAVGLNLSTSAADGRDPAAAAREVERLGFDFVCASDHLHGSHPTFETWTMLTWIAAATERVRIVPNVLGLPYRSPAVLAKMAETLDRLSGGRLVLGLGAGGADAEFEAFGLGVRTPGEKVDGLEDALHIMRRLWTEPTVTVDGTIYSTRGATIEPKPIRPVPIWIGGFGPRSMRLLGRLADGWLPSMAFVPPDRVLELREIIRSSASAAGRDPDAIDYAYNVTVAVGRHGDDDRVVSGSAAEVSERLAGLVERLGLTALNIWPVGESDEQVAAIATDVLPGLR